MRRLVNVHLAQREVAGGTMQLVRAPLSTANGPSITSNSQRNNRGASLGKKDEGAMGGSSSQSDPASFSSAGSMSAHKSATSPSSSASGSSKWMRDTLHYDTAKVQQLAGIFTGTQSVKDGGEREKLTTKKQRGVRASEKSVEERLRQPAHRTTQPPIPAKRSSSNVLRQPQVYKRGSGAALKEAEQREKDTNESEHIRRWSSALLDSSDAKLAATVKSLLTLHRVVESNSPAFSSSSWASILENASLGDRNAMEVLLTRSRLAWHFSFTASLPLHFMPDAAAAAAADTVHRLCLLASAMEASCKTFRETESAFADNLRHTASPQPTSSPLKAAAEHTASRTMQPVSTSKSGEEKSSDVDAWRLRCLAGYKALLSDVASALLSALASVSKAKSTEAPRGDVLTSALLSLLHCTAICAHQVTSTRHLSGVTESAERAIGEGSTSAFNDAEHARLLQELSAEVSKAMMTYRVGSPHAPPASLKGQAGQRRGEQQTTLEVLRGAAASACSLRQQLYKLEKQLHSALWSRDGQCCVQGVRYTLFALCSTVLREAMRAEVAGNRGASAEQAGDAHEETTSHLPHFLQLRGGIDAILTGSEKVQLATHAESLYATICPKPEVSRAAQLSLVYRSTSTTLSVMLSSLWQHARKRNTPQPPLKSKRDDSFVSQAGARADVAPAAEQFTSQSAFLEQHPELFACLLQTYMEVLAVADEHVALALALDKTAPTSTVASRDLSWVVPLNSRVVRMGMSMQLDATILAAAHLGLEARSPRSPQTSLDKVVAARVSLRRKTEQRRQRAAEQQSCLQGEGKRLREERVDDPTSTEAAHQRGSGEGMAAAALLSAQWGRVFRLSGALRVTACEALYRAVVGIADVCAQSPAAARTFLSQAASSSTASASPAIPPASALVKAVSRVFFTIPRTEYLFGLMTDDVVTPQVAAEQSRRVYTACAGTLLWLRELAPPFGSHFKDEEGSTIDYSAAPSAAGGDAHPDVWLVCGTSKANALEGAFFLTYLLHHWPSSSTPAQSVPLHHHPRYPTSRSIASDEQYDSAEKQTLADGDAACLSSVAAPPVDPLLSTDTVQAYVTETLFWLQHDTASLLRHLRTTNRFFHFTGETKDKAGLMQEAALQQRHVASTLSVVQAFERQPNFVWMPLETMQEMIFVLNHFPHLILMNATATDGKAAPSRAKKEEVGEDSERDSADDHEQSNLREYPQVQVGTIVCTFARAHGYLVRRLHVLSGVLREYRGQVLKSSSAASSTNVETELFEEEADVGKEKEHATTANSVSSQKDAGSRPPSSFVRCLLDNARHTPQEATHRANNYAWAHPLATMLLEDFPRLPAQIEGTASWSTGVARALQRMELLMNDATRHHWIINVVKSQQQYRSQKRIQRQHQNESREKQDDSPSDAWEDVEAAAATTQEEGSGENVLRRIVHVRVVRPSLRVPLGVALDGDGRILRVQQRVAAPVEGVEQSRAERQSDLDLEELPSPFAAGVADSLDRFLDGDASVVGARVSAVDGVPVSTGREVAAQVHGKTAFTLTVEI